MAVAYDAASESDTAATITGDVSHASFSWTHTPVGTPKGVLVFVTAFADAEKTTSVTYGGVPMTLVDSAHQNDGTKPGRCTAYFLGSGIPTGAQTVVVNRVNDATTMYAMAVTVTALTDTAVTAATKVESVSASLTEYNIDDGSPGTNSLRFAAVKTGLAGIPAAGANSTATISADWGTHCAAVVRESAAGQGSRPVGFNAGVNTQAVLALGVLESVSAAGYPKTLFIV